MCSGSGIPQSNVWLFLASNHLARASIIDSIPSSCTQACQILAADLDACDWGSCLCTDDDAQGLESCMNCLYGASPTQNIYDAAQGTFSVFEEMCNPALNVSLNISPISSSSTASPSSANSSAASSSTSSLSISSAASSPSMLSTTTSLFSSTYPTTSSSIPPSTPSQGINEQADYENQKCSLVAKKGVPKIKRSLFGK
ncbi:hypothetical protein CPB84DRAFT_1797690 [Gymnopilus junonius]|uniref:Uncharacterized protein n=1 Tax=Gymnopilus junonius TaxID=109634 RepID=A0A9P5N9R7_GYMJU|nr:hypothetical protein CPB84DRAFT_1797690 [Gymnopilus junonius]